MKSDSLKSTEDRELDKIAKLKKELELRRKQSEDSRRMALKSMSYIPAQSKQPTTKPADIHFATDTRVKSNQAEKADEKELDFKRTLRSNSQKSVSVNLPFDQKKVLDTVHKSRHFDFPFRLQLNLYDQPSLNLSHFTTGRGKWKKEQDRPSLFQWLKQRRMFLEKLRTDSDQKREVFVV